MRALHKAECMKYAIILPDGAADEPVAILGGRTPLEVAHKPQIDSIAQKGRQGIVTTVPPGFSPGSDICTMSLLGYDPRACHSGRAPLEAAAQGITLREDEIVFRCNFVTLVDGVMADFTAGHISNRESRLLIDHLNANLGEPRCRFHPGVSYRNLLVISQAQELDPQCTPPHDIPDQPVAAHLPRGRGADWLRELMRRAHDLLHEHELNSVRRDLGENPATDVWLWGQGRSRTLTPFAERFGVPGACIAAVDLIRGLAKVVGLRNIWVPGATGYLDTDYAAKGRYAVEALREHDLVIVHVEAPDEAGHLGDARAKVLALEQIDAHVVGPVLAELRRHDRWRILVAPDHPTPVEKRVHTGDAPPFCVAGFGLDGVLGLPFSEANARQSDFHLNPGHELMEFFIRGAGA